MKPLLAKEREMRIEQSQELLNRRPKTTWYQTGGSGDQVTRRKLILVDKQCCGLEDGRIKLLICRAVQQGPIGNAPSDLFFFFNFSEMNSLVEITCRGKMYYAMRVYFLVFRFIYIVLV